MTGQFSDTVRAVSGGFFLTMLVVLVMGMFGIQMPSLLSSGGCLDCVRPVGLRRSARVVVFLYALAPTLQHKPSP